ncbi:hypothetical protein PBV87_12755 [Niameybacter massiliensis]|uniref:Uncharacterized protein n=1 Tax=Holtiella tumoricola TaxID=3018743 RepID=A0AA42DPG5_9FIRM|nr:hypothetical protein [Holtiella tumoricola]MDA3732358.1 hypothetical protein [Holtiella tumoricola]
MQGDCWSVHVNEEVYEILRKLAREQDITMSQLTIKLILEEKAYREIYGYERMKIDEQENEEENFKL